MQDDYIQTLISSPPITLLIDGDVYKGYYRVAGWEVERYDNNENRTPTIIDYDDLPIEVKSRLDSALLKAIELFTEASDDSPDSDLDSDQ